MGILSGGIYRGISATNNLIFLAVSDNGVYGIPPAMAIFIEGSLEVKLPTIWTDGKAEVGRVREEKRREEERRSEKRKSQKKEDVGARKGRKVAEHCVFPMICGSHGSKSRLAKVAGAEPSGQMRDEKLHAVVARSRFRGQNAQNTSAPGARSKVEMSKNCTPLWREADFEVKTYKTHQHRTTFGSWDVETVHAVVARSTFPSQNVQSTRTLSKVSKTWVFCGIFPTTMAGVGHLKRIWKDACRVAGAVQETCYYCCCCYYYYYYYY